MTFLSEKLSQIRPSATIAISTLAAEMRAQGRDVIALSAGEPDFDTPEPIKEAAIAAIAAGHTKYTAPDGLPELKAAICAKFARDNGIAYETQNITVASGGKQVLYNALLATLNPGDEVLFQAPYWVSYPDMVRLCGGVPVAVPTRADAGFRLSPEALAAAITPATKWLILNSPSNPSGVGYSAEDLRALGAVLLEHPQIWVLCDDIYEHLAYDGFTFATMAQAVPELKGRVLTMNGVSKSYAMTGWRIGFGGGPKPLIDAMRKVQSQTTSNPCTISQHAAIAALEGAGDLYVTEARPVFQRRRDLVVQALNAIEGVDCPVPQGAFYVYPSIAGLIGKCSSSGMVITSDEVFCTELLRETGVAVVFGAAFGLSPHFRVSYAAADAALIEACARIAEFCGKLS